jgi:hypothetical protein
MPHPSDEQTVTKHPMQPQTLTQHENTSMQDTEEVTINLGEISAIKGMKACLINDPTCESCQ